MKYSCLYIDKGINFFYDAVRICCKSAHNGKGMPVLCSYENFSVEKIYETKNRYKEMLNNGIIPDECKGCVFVKETETSSDENFISIIDIDSFTTCNSKCIYCDMHRHTPVSKPVLPILKELFNKKLIKNDEGGYIQFAGGEPTIMKDFDKILDLCMKNGINNYMIHTNGIKYSKSIEKLLNKFNIKLIISPDAGSKETYERIKNVPYFNDVIKNMEKYAKAQKKSNISVRSKYIIIPGINDNLAEITKWYDLSVSLGVKMLILDVEMQWFKAHNQAISRKISDMITFIQEKCKCDGIILDYYESLKVWFNNEKKLL